MVGPYRLKEFGIRLPAGSHLLSPEALGPVESASAIVAEAEARSADMAAAAARAFEEEKQRGYQEGLTAARRHSFEQLLAESRQLDQSLDKVQAGLTDVVVASVRKIIDDFDDTEKAEAVVRAGLRQMRRERRAELFVPRALGAHFRDRIAAIVADFPDCDSVDVVESDELQGSAVILETAIGRIEGEIGSSLDEVEAALRRGMGVRLAPPVVETREP